MDKISWCKRIVTNCYILFLVSSMEGCVKNIWVPVSGAIAQQKSVETIANNVANANTPGFKKDQLAFREYLSVYENGLEQDIDLPNKEWAPKDFYRSYGAENAMVKTDGSFTLFDQGQLTPTGNPLDLAVQGEGFFEVLTPNGIRYTRNGQFNVGEDGRLINDKGHALLQKLDLTTLPTGPDTPALNPQDRIVKVNSTEPISINLKGEIFQGSQKVGDISVIEFKDLHTLRKEGSGYFINAKNSNINPEIKSNVHQGFIEESNVNAVQEMAELIKASRQFESLQNAIRTYDTISGKAVNEISRF